MTGSKTQAMAVSTESSDSRRPVPDKRVGILAAALRVFSERGVNGVAVPEIASAAGVATGTIYRYFESKEALVNELYRQEKAALHEYLYGGLDRDREPRAVFDEVWDRMVRYARERPEVYRFIELQDHQSYLDEESLALQRRMLLPMVNRVKAMQGRGVYRKDVRDRVLIAMGWGAFVNLLKVERDGLLTLRRKDLLAARELCWQLYTGECPG